MAARRRGLREIKTLGLRGRTGGDQRALLRASSVEAELQRLRQERRLLEQRISVIDEGIAKLALERESLISGLDVKRTEDVMGRADDGRNFHLHY